MNMRPEPGRPASPVPGALTLTVLGSAASWSRTPGRASSSYLVRLGADSLVLDLGQGSFAELAGRLDPASLRAVLISHLHPDHCVDLVPLRHYLRYGCTPPAQVPLRGPVSLRARFDALLGEPDFLALLPGPPLAPGGFDVGGMAVQVAAVRHEGESFAFRVSVGADPSRPGIVYSGDCGHAEDLLDLVRPGDTLLAEASFGAGNVPPGVGHLSATDSAGAAARAGAGRLILTHLLDGSDPEAALAVARSLFSREVLVARPGLTIEA